MLLRDDSADQNETEVDFLQLECHRPLKRVKSLLLNDTNFIVYHVLVQRVLQFQSCKGSQSAAWSIHEASNKLIYLRHFFFFSSFLSSISVLTMRLLQDSSRPLCFWSLHQSWSSRCSSLSGIPRSPSASLSLYMSMFFQGIS